MSQLRVYETSRPAAAAIAELSFSRNNSNPFVSLSACRLYRFLSRSLSRALSHPLSLAPSLSLSLPLSSLTHLPLIRSLCFARTHTHTRARTHLNTH